MMRLSEMEKKARAYLGIKATSAPKKDQRGMVLMLTFIIIITLIAIVAAFLYLTSARLKGSGYDVTSRKAFWLAEAGLQKALWYLETPAADGGEGEDWTTTTPLTENFGGGSYTITVTPSDFALASDGATASDSPGHTDGYPPENVNDANDSFFWESNAAPSSGTPQTVTIHFPYTLRIYQAGFVVPVGSQSNAPGVYTWQVSANGTDYTTVYSGTNPGVIQTDIFTTTPPLRPNVNYLRLSITSPRTPGYKVRIGTLNVKGCKITSTGTMGGINRTIERTMVVKESTQGAYGITIPGYGYAENDWKDKGSL